MNDWLKPANLKQLERESGHPIHVCSTPQCLKGIGLWQPFLMVWAKGQGVDDDKECVRISLPQFTFCQECCGNKSLPQLLAANEEIWLKVRKAFQDPRVIKMLGAPALGGPDRDTVKLGWQMAAMAKRRERL